MTIIPRGDRFGVKVWDRGKKRYRWVGSFDTEAEARQVESDASLKPGRDLYTVEQWARIWLSDYVRPAKSTQETYRYDVDKIVGDVGRLKLSEISRPEARRWANKWPRNRVRTARTMWGDAVRDGICEVNPWTNLGLETPKGRKDIDALTHGEVQQLGELALRVHGDYGPEARAIILTMAYTAMRPAEVCALRRRDLDLANREVTVAGSRTGTKGRKLPKNGLGRKVVLPERAIEAIRVVPETVGSEHLFHSKRGHPLNKGTLHYIWKEVRAAWIAEGGRYITPYWLRHAGATMLIEDGHAVGDVAFQLGHQDGGRLVMELYGHPAEDAIRDRLKMTTTRVERTQSVRSGRAS
ncbi:MAG TPA: site-specific integrase [Solirubrobacteraceae bacterium]|jgi:integrase